uniref:Preprotein-translocase subunit g n=1 Tax=Dasyclonium flaccidum TaxID=2007274 RepID=A0A1Z1MKR3_9FLOR|nr:preprotein-translocase subunit g [Dasyclonium flaccidum]ARW66648.1 preprotein-translocase subunit g [Dasyclonium flaccidum]
MFIKIFWYIFSLLTILLIMLNSPSSSGLNNLSGQNKTLNFRPNQLVLQQLIGLNICIFFLLTILSLLYFN